MAIDRSNRSLGDAVRSWREDRGLSVEALARQAGIAPSTVRRWESGLTMPHEQPLLDVLAAMNVPAAERMRICSLLSAPRALSAAMASAVTGLEYGGAAESARTKKGDFLYWTPRKGDLWRALRKRQGLRGKQLAEAVGVGADEVTRWEKSERSPRPELLPLLFATLKPSADEQAALSDPSPLFHVSGAVSGAARGVEALDWEEKVFGLQELVDTVPGFPGDLYLRVLEAELAPHAVRGDPRAMRLLGRTYTWHGEWLHRQGRSRERKPVLERAGELLIRGDVSGDECEAPEGSGLWAHWLCLHAAYVVGHPRNPQARRQAYRGMTDALALLPAGDRRAARARCRLLREIPRQMDRNDRKEAFRHLDEAKALSERLGDAALGSLAATERMYVHLAAGETDAALRLLPPLTDPDTPGADYSGVVGERVHYVKVFYAAGDLRNADVYLADYQRITHRFGYFGWGIGDIADRL